MAGPSRTKRSKLSFKNPDKLTDNELLACLLDSSDGNIFKDSQLSDSDDVFIYEGSWETDKETQKAGIMSVV